MYRVRSFLCTWLCGASHADPTNRETTRQNTMGNGHHEKWKRGGDLKNGISAKTNSAMRASEEKSWRVWSCGLYHHAELSASMKRVPHISHTDRQIFRWFMSRLSSSWKQTPVLLQNLPVEQTLMAIRRAFLVMTLMQSGYCLRADHAHEVHNADLSADLLESDSDVTFGKKCCCYRPVGDKVYENPWGSSCPVRPSRGCAYPQKASPCKVGPNKYDVYCEWYYALGCGGPRRPENIMWNKPWQRKYDNMWRKWRHDFWRDKIRSQIISE